MLRAACGSSEVNLSPIGRVRSGVGGGVVCGQGGDGGGEVCDQAGDGDAEDSLVCGEGVDDFVASVAVVDGGAVAEQCGGSQVVDAEVCQRLQCGAYRFQ